MERTNIYLESAQSAALDRLAAEEGTSRAEIIRRIIDRALAGSNHDLRVDLDAINTSFGVLTDVEPHDRRPDERERHLDRMWRLGA